MKHFKKQIQRHLKKISKTSIKKWATTLTLIFFTMVMLFQKDIGTSELQFVRNADEVFMHNAANENPPASQRDYLFQNEAGNPEYQWQLTQWQAPLVGTSLPTETIDNLINPDEVSQVIWWVTGQIVTGTTYSWTIYSGSIETWTIMTGDILETGSLDCITPRKEKVQNKDFVLAYQQRKDVNTICNIEKRVCLSGTLGGTFEQRSCQENVVYNYTKVAVISYNQKVLNEYIQPTDPVNIWAEFNTEGKIDAPETQPTTERGTTKNTITTGAEVKQTPLSTKASCTAPRGQKIAHGQFIKAYKAPRWFIDLPCEVEIRACVNGKIKWTFTYTKCTFNNTTYTDYLKAGSPTSNTGFLFFERIKKSLKFGR